MPAVVRITTRWVDHTELRILTPPDAPALDVKEEEEERGGRGGGGEGKGKVLSVSDAKVLLSPDALKYMQGTYVIEATVPEKSNVQCHLWSGDIGLRNKMEGDIDLMTKHG